MLNEIAHYLMVGIILIVIALALLSGLKELLRDKVLLVTILILAYCFLVGFGVITLAKLVLMGAGYEFK